MARISTQHVIAIVIGLGVMVAAVGLGFFGQDAERSASDCYNLGLGEVRSPDEAFALTTVLYVCGDQADDAVTNVNLVAFDKGVTKVLGPVLAADRNQGKAPVGPQSGLEIRVRWTDARSATIAHHGDAHTISTERSLGGVALTFETFR